jgi:hypothetical protein
MKSIFIKKLVMLSIALLMISSMLVSAQPVYAGSNGQQLVITVPSWASATVTGNNQNGQRVTGTFRSGQWVGGRIEPNAAVTFGWWWVGNVDIYVKGKHCTANVPKFQGGSNFVNVYCR